MQMVPPHAIGTLIASNVLGTDSYMPPPQENNSTSIPGEASALHLAWHTSGYPRFLFGMYAAFGIIFFGIAIFSALSVFMNSLNTGSVSIFGTAIPLCYIVINIIAGWGFMFYRKWLLAVFSIMLFLKVLLAVLVFMNSRDVVSPTGIIIMASISLFLFLTRRLLSGRYFTPTVVVSFILILLTSFLLTNFGMLH